MSAWQSKYSCAPPGPSRKPVYTSSKMSTMPLSWHTVLSRCSQVEYLVRSRSDLRLSVASTTSEGGGELAWKAWRGLTITAAISDARSESTRSEDSARSTRVSTSSGFRSLPAVDCTPSHHPWYAPANMHTSGFFVLNRARRTADMTASVPLMWNDTSSILEIPFRSSTFRRRSGWTGPRTHPRSFTFSHPLVMNSLYRSYPTTLTPYEPEMSSCECPSRSIRFIRSVCVVTVNGSHQESAILRNGRNTRLPAAKRRSEKAFRSSREASSDLGHLPSQWVCMRSHARSRSSATSSGGSSDRKKSCFEK
mmetsp:Transcript_8514/g.21874  ORF Transcript_8514/g.21874 Transcript_8514/m.21874 type:complete len:308 (+) Transcript_8514:712-1635(+)